MKKVSINLLTNVILLLAGIILIVFHGVPNILIWGARVLGVTFVLPAVAYLIMVAVRHADARTSTDYMGVFPAVGGLCFGLVMIIKAHLFDGILQLLLSVLLVVLGLFHIIYLLLSKSSLNIKGWYFVLPIIVVLYGILSLSMPAMRENVSTVVMLTGVGLLMFNITSVHEYFAERRVRRALSKPATELAPVADDSAVETTINADELE